MWGIQHMCIHQDEYHPWIWIHDSSLMNVIIQTSILLWWIDAYVITYPQSWLKFIAKELIYQIWFHSSYLYIYLFILLFFHGFKTFVIITIVHFFPKSTLHQCTHFHFYWNQLFIFQRRQRFHLILQVNQRQKSILFCNLVQILFLSNIWN